MKASDHIAINMEVEDNELEASLLQQFSTLGTTDKDVLITQFQTLLGAKPNLNRNYCAFFLDMNNWNLQAAIGAYYDFDQPNIQLPSMAFVRDVTIGEGESVPPNTKFIKTWRLQNSGNEKWSPGCTLRYVGGEQFGNRDTAMVDALDPSATADISVEMTSPGSSGTYQGQWRMCTATGMYFGEIIWVILTVEEGGVLGLTQQMSSFAGELINNPETMAMDNPFASIPTSMSQELLHSSDQNLMLSQTERSQSQPTFSPSQGFHSFNQSADTDMDAS